MVNPTPNSLFTFFSNLVDKKKNIRMSKFSSFHHKKTRKELGGNKLLIWRAGRERLFLYCSRPSLAVPRRIQCAEDERTFNIEPLL